MFHIKLKTTIHIEIGPRILHELRADEALINADKFERIKNDCETLQMLRVNIAQPNAQLIHLEKYFCALQATKSKFPLHNSQFAWSNSLGFSNALVQSNGLWFEALNIAFNIGAKLTQMVSGDAKSWLKAAGMFVYACENLIPPDEIDHLSPELQPCTLRLLANLCLAQASDLKRSDTAATKWAVAKSYSAVLEQLKDLPVKIVKVEEIYQDRIKTLISEAYLIVGEELIHSRKLSNLALAKSALSQCLQMNSRSRETNDKAITLLGLPVNRRSRTVIGDIESSEVFDGSSHFQAQTGLFPILWAPSDPTLQALFNALPPSHLLPLSILLKYHMSHLVRKHIADQYRLLNQNVRNAAVKANLPVAVEVLQSSTRIPPTLISYGEMIVKSGGSKELDNRFSECTKTISQLDGKLRENLDKRENPGEIKALIAKIQQAEMLHTNLLHHWSAIKKLIRILEGGADALVEYLNLTNLRTAPGGFQPIFLTKVQDIWSKISKSIVSRESLRAQVLTKLDKTHIDEAVQKYIYANSGDVKLSSAFLSIISQLWGNFNDDLVALEMSTRKSQSQIKVLNDLSVRFATMHKPSTIHTARLVRSQALTGAWATWCDLNDRIDDLASNLAALDLPLRDSINRSCFVRLEKHQTPTEICRLSERPESQLLITSQRKFVWKPGKDVNIV